MLQLFCPNLCTASNSYVFCLCLFTNVLGFVIFVCVQGGYKRLQQIQYFVSGFERGNSGPDSNLHCCKLGWKMFGCIWVQ